MLRKAQGNSGHTHLIPLTLAQKNIYSLHAVDPSGYACSLAHYRDIRGPFDVSQFTKAVGKVLRSVPTYRVAIEMSGQTPYLREVESFEPSLIQLDFSQDANPFHAAH